MFKGKFVVLTLIVAAVALSISLMPGANTAYSGIVDAELSEASAPPGPAANHCMLTDPVGQGAEFEELGAIISLRAKDITNTDIPDIPASDCWVIGATDNVCLCGGSASSNADSVTNAEGRTTISGAIRGGGYDAGLQAVIQATIITQGDGSQLVLPITSVSTDIDCDLASDTPDFILFEAGYTAPPKVYQAALDYNCDGLVELIDFTLFAQHFLQQC